MLRSSQAVFDASGPESASVTVPVDCPYKDFSSYRLTVTYNPSSRNIISLSFASENYVLTMTPSA